MVRELALSEGATFRPATSLFRDFAIRCRQQSVASAHIDIARFRRMFACEIGGLARLEGGIRQHVESIIAGVEDDVLAPFLAMADFLYADDFRLGQGPTRRFYEFFLKGYVHKHNNLMGVIQGFSALILFDDTINEEVRESAEQMQTSARAATDLNREILGATGCARCGHRARRPPATTATTRCPASTWCHSSAGY